MLKVLRIVLAIIMRMDQKGRTEVMLNRICDSQTFWFQNPSMLLKITENPKVYVS